MKLLYLLLGSFLLLNSSTCGFLGNFVKGIGNGVGSLVDDIVHVPVSIGTGVVKGSLNIGKGVIKSGKDIADAAVDTIACNGNEEFRYMQCERVCNVHLACLQYQNNLVTRKSLTLDLGQSEFRPKDPPMDCYCKKGYVLNNLREKKCIPEEECLPVINLTEALRMYEKSYGESIPDTVLELLVDRDAEETL